MKMKVFLISLIFLAIDIITKLIANFYLELTTSFKIINKFFYLTKVYNYGASWSILSGKQIFLILFTIIMLGILFIYQNHFQHNKRNILAFSMLYGGIIGNLLNRIIYGFVIDFLDFKIFGYDFPVFNCADIFIVLGIMLLIIAIWKKEDESVIKRK